MRKTIHLLTAMIALNFLAACATTNTERHAAQETVTVWEVSETPFLRAVKKNITVSSDKAQEVTSQNPVKTQETKTR